MDAAAAMEITRAALILILVVAWPMLGAALVTGVVIGLLQALTQIQEQTLTFVPKLLAMGAALSDFMRIIADHVAHG
jgi:flagellar biosynthetic protein FliQ